MCIVLYELSLVAKSASNDAKKVPSQSLVNGLAQSRCDRSLLVTFCWVHRMFWTSSLLAVVLSHTYVNHRAALHFTYRCNKSSTISLPSFPYRSKCDAFLTPGYFITEAWDGLCTMVTTTATLTTTLFSCHPMPIIQTNHRRFTLAKGYEACDQYRWQQWAVINPTRLKVASVTFVSIEVGQTWNIHAPPVHAET